MKTIKEIEYNIEGCNCAEVDGSHWETARDILLDVLGLIDELLIKYKYNPAGLEELKARIKEEIN